MSKKNTGIPPDNGNNESVPAAEFKLIYANKQALKEYQKLPQVVIDEFNVQYQLLQMGLKPTVDIKRLTTVIGRGVVELIINGSPAFRSVYVIKEEGVICILHSFTKTTSSTDRQAMKTAKERFKSYLAEIKA